MPLVIAAIPPPITLLASRDDAGPYLGRYDVRILRDEPGLTRRRLQGTVSRPGDTLRWRTPGGPEAERRDFILGPAGEHEFTGWRAGPRTGSQAAGVSAIVSFTMDKGRATGFEVQLENGSTVAGHPVR